MFLTLKTFWAYHSEFDTFSDSLAESIWGGWMPVSVGSTMLKQSQQPTKYRFTIKTDCWSFQSGAGGKSLMERDTVSTGNHVPVQTTLL